MSKLNLGLRTISLGMLVAIKYFDATSLRSPLDYRFRKNLDLPQHQEINFFSAPCEEIELNFGYIPGKPCINSCSKINKCFVGPEDS